jgi:hypothetical protein
VHDRHKRRHARILLPDGIAAAVHRLWQQRMAAHLNILYRSAVNRLAIDLGAVLPPGATESRCHGARRLPDQAYAKCFLRIVY